MISVYLLRFRARGCFCWLSVWEEEGNRSSSCVSTLFIPTTLIQKNSYVSTFKAFRFYVSQQLNLGALAITVHEEICLWIKKLKLWILELWILLIL